ncbi:hypothetical protein BV25DRAFT_1830893 [Artomyces pyxidatus]|uniref:Uncharacterized protein n=1 Tax=Artomyces pyxidatus TaxID=48021 RepID=A0ACB8SNH3_9AGAM|nr:hypothetical protein BV25DRAFT_1830893 [Artomyces pyxidatus]
MSTGQNHFKDAKINKSNWGEAETTALVAFLLDRKTDIHSTGGFPTETWIGASGSLAAIHRTTRSPGACQGKWNRLRDEYKAVRRLKSDFVDDTNRWTDDKGLTLGQGQEERWDKYLQVDPSAAAYLGIGFKHFSTMREILSTKSKSSGARRGRRPRIRVERTASPEAANPPPAASTPTIPQKRASGASDAQASTNVPSNAPNKKAHLTQDPAPGGSVSAPDPSPSRDVVPKDSTRFSHDVVARARKIVQTESIDDLTDEEMVKIVRLFSRSPQSAEEYVELLRESARKHWVASTLQELV